MKLIYVLDDDKNITNILKLQLQNDGYLVQEFSSGVDLIEKFNVTRCNLIITDIMMPQISGYDVCREIRKISDVPIIMISAKDEEIDRILGLELGSDDYISKPFSLRELSIKVKNMLRRYNFYNDEFLKSNNVNIIKCKDLTLMLDTRSILLKDTEFKVTTKEYDLLKLFIENKNKAFSREMIIRDVWGYDYYGDNRQVDHIIKRLRKKLLLENSEFNIETIWGYGYKVSD